MALGNKAAYVETSAKLNTNVGQYPPCFRLLARALLTCISTVPPPFLCSTGKVFELCLGEIERLQPNHNSEPTSSKCLIM